MKKKKISYQKARKKIFLKSVIKLSQKKEKNNSKGLAGLKEENDKEAEKDKTNKINLHNETNSKNKKAKINSLFDSPPKKEKIKPTNESKNKKSKIKKYDYKQQLKNETLNVY